MSTRTRVKSFDQTVSTSTYNPTTRTWTPFVPHPTNSLSWSVNETRTTTPDSVQGWAEKLAQHQSATTALTAVRYTSTQGSGFATRRNYQRPGTLVSGASISGNLSPVAALMSPKWTAPSTSYLTNRALTRFMSDCYQAQHTLQGLVCLGELGQTVRAIRHPLKTLYESMFDYLDAAKVAARRARRANRRGNISGSALSRNRTSSERRRAVQRAVAGTYLESVFGWVPLVNDVYAAAEAAARIITYRPPTVPVKGFARDTVLSVPDKDIRSWGAGITLTSTVQRSCESSVKLYGAMINRSGWDGAIADVGFDLRSWAPTLWELLPYSFVVDYFTNFGAIIEALSVNQDDIAWVNIGTKNDYRATVIDVSINPLGSTPFYYDEGTFLPGILPSSSCVEVSRSPYVGSLIPQVEFTIPGLGMRWLNISALIAQAAATSREIRL